MHIHTLTHTGHVRYGCCTGAVRLLHASADGTTLLFRVMVAMVCLRLAMSHACLVGLAYLHRMCWVSEHALPRLWLWTVHCGPLGLVL